MNRPALRIAIPLVVADGLSAAVPTVEVICAVVIPLALVLALRWQPDLVVGLLAAAAGIVLGNSARMVLPFDGLYELRPAPCRVEGVVTSIRHSDSLVIRMVVSGVIDRQDLPPVAHRALVTIWSPDSLDGCLSPGHQVVITGTCSSVPRGQVQDDVIQRAMLLAKDAWWTVRAHGRQVDGRSAPAHWTSWLRSLQQWLQERLRSTLPDHVWPVAIALVTGDASMIDPTDRYLMAVTGTAHMLSVSGSHVALVASVIMLLTTWLPPRARIPSVLFAMLCFVMLTGAEPPAVRAFVAMACVVIGLAAERHIDPWNVLGTTIIVMICIDPVLPWRTSVQLSIAGVVGILLWHGPLQRALERAAPSTWKPASTIRSMLSVSMAASTGVAIPAAIIFGSVALLSPVANLFVVPLLSLAMLAASAAAVLPAGWLYAPYVTIGVEWALDLARCFSWLHIQPSWPCTVAVIGVASTSWLCASRDARSFRWRFGIGTLVTVGVMVIPDNQGPRMEQHVRTDVIAVVSTNAVVPVMLIKDRKGAGDMPRADRALAKHVMQYRRLVVLEDGLCASATVDMIEDSIPVVRRPLRRRRASTASEIVESD